MLLFFSSKEFHILLLFSCHWFFFPSNYFVLFRKFWLHMVLQKLVLMWLMLCSLSNHMNVSWHLILVIGSSCKLAISIFQPFRLLVAYHFCSLQLGQVTSLLTSGSRTHALTQWKPLGKDLHLRCWALLAQLRMLFRYELALVDGLELPIRLNLC